MWGNLKETWKNLRILSEYTSSQIDALNKLRSFCEKHLKINLHDTVFEIDDKGLPTEHSQKTH